MYDFDDGWSYEHSCMERDAREARAMAYEDWMDLLEEEHQAWEAEVAAGNPGPHRPDRRDFIGDDDLPF